MAKRRIPQQFTHYRLMPGVVDELQRRGVWPTARELRDWFRENKRSGSVEHDYKHLHEGLGVTEAVVTGLFDYLADNRVFGYTRDSHAEPAPPPPDPAKEGAWWDFFKSDAVSSERARRAYCADDTMYLDNPEREIPSIVTEWLGTLGSLTNPQLTGNDAVRRGEKIRGMTVDQLSSWLRTVYSEDYRTIMYAAESGARIGVSAIIPISSEVYDKIASGRMRSEHITPADMPPAGKATCVFIEMLAPVGRGTFMAVRDRSAAETHTFMYQVAYFTRGLRPSNPVILAPAANDLYRQRMRRHGFRPTGHPMKDTQYPMMSILPNHGLFGFHTASYAVMNLILRRYRKASKSIWRREDDSEE